MRIQSMGVIAMLTLGLTLCAGCRTTKIERAEPPPHAVDHVVLCWLKTPGDEAARKQLVNASHEFLKTIPGLLRVDAGPVLPSTRPGVDASFDVGVVMIFCDEAALAAYNRSDAHQRAVQETLRPLTAKVVTYDFTPSTPAQRKTSDAQP